MIVRIEWQFSHPRRIVHMAPKARRSIRRTKEASVQGWVIITGLTILFVIWLAYHSVGRPDWLATSPPAVAELVGLVETAGAFTLGFLWFTLWWQRQKSRNSPLPAKDLTELLALSPAEFERYVAHLFSKKGYRVKLRGSKGDLGVDLELTRSGGKQAIVQCKRYHNTIEPKIVRELYGTLVHERVSHAFLVTTAEISDAAREWARYKPITLIDGKTLAQIAAALGETAVPAHKR